MKKDIFDKIKLKDLFDKVDLDLFDQVELPVEDKVIFSDEMRTLLREEINTAVKNIPVGELVSKLLNKEIVKQKEVAAKLKKEIVDSKVELTHKLTKSQKEIEEFKDKIRFKYDDLKNEFLSFGNQRLYFGGPAAMRIQEEDGSDLGYPNSLKFSNGSITVNSDGSYSISSGGSSFSIPQLTTDPSSPSAGDTWVLKQGGDAGTPMGLLLALTYSGNEYFLSYQTEENTTVRTELT